MLCQLNLINDNQKTQDNGSHFYQKVAFSNVGIVGHSQSGVGVINAITDTALKDIHKTAVSLSPTSKELADNLMWNYDAAKVNVPILLISGAGGEDDIVVTGEQLKSDTHAAAASTGAIRKLKQTRSTRINILIFTEYERPRRNALLPRPFFLLVCFLLSGISSWIQTINCVVLTDSQVMKAESSMAFSYYPSFWP